MLQETINKSEYDFLRQNIHLGNNIILLGLSGSRAYGTQTENSDWDVRGIALNTSKEILLGKDFEQVEDITTDTVVYSFKKIIRLLIDCNPNIIELLGLKQEQYFVLKPVGKQILAEKKMFLSQRAIKSFEGFINQQYRRLKNNTVNYQTVDDQQEYIFKKRSKHMMHIVRLYYMCFDIIERAEIITYRKAEHNLLMDIRNGKYLDENLVPTSDYWELLDAFSKRLEYAKQNTILPEQPDIERIEEFVIDVHKSIVG